MENHDITPGVKGLIFDLDGTLADSMPWHYKAWQITCSRYNMVMDPHLLQALTGAPGWKIAGEVIKTNNMSGRISPDELLQVKLEEFITLQHNVKPIEPVVALVRRYHGMMPMAVGTGGHRRAVELTLEVTGLSDYFEIVVTANDVTNHKPHPETFLTCARLMNIDPALCEVFEDGDLGIEAARRAGMQATDVRPWYISDWQGNGNEGAGRRSGTKSDKR